MSNYKPKTGDVVRVVLEGEVRTDWGDSFVIGRADEGGSTIAGKSKHVVSVEQVKPALQVGWHRAKYSEGDPVEALYWDGSAWFYNEKCNTSTALSWESVGYLGTGVKA